MEYETATVAAFATSPLAGMRAAEAELLQSCAGAETSLAPDFDAFVEGWRSRGTAGTPCTSVWTVGAIAYRCRTCQMNDSSAICVACFKTGGHEEHDYVMYRSDAGGCCDCGDVSSWKPEGCCPLHRPAREAARALSVALPPPAFAAAQSVLALVFERLVLAVEVLAAARAAKTGAASYEQAQRADATLRDEEAAAAALVAWLQRVCAAAALRAPAAAAVLAGAPHTEPGEAPEAQLAALACRTAPVGCAEQTALRATLDAAGLLPPSSASSAALQRRAWPLLDRLLCADALHALGEELLESITTLLLLMLYDRPFKEQFTHALMRHYRTLVCHGQEEDAEQELRMSHCLDRVTVQLFNASEVTLRLARHHSLLHCLIGLLRDEIAPWDQPAAAEGEDTAMAAQLPASSAHAAAAAAAAALDDDDDGVAAVAPAAAMVRAVDLGRPVAEGRLYSRVVGDLRMVLAHPPVALHFLERCPGLVASLLAALAALQGANAEARRRGDHVELESHAWLNAVALEVSLLSLWVQAVDATADAPPPPHAPAVVPFVLARAAAAALRAAAAWAAADDADVCAALGGAPFCIDTHPVSVHLPLHRAAALALAPLLQGAPRAAGGPPAALAALRDAAACAGGLALLARHPSRVRAWAAAVRARLWVRNGAGTAQLEHVYGSPFWAEAGADADLLFLQLCVASAASAAEADALAEELLLHTAAPQLVSAVEAHTQAVTAIQLPEGASDDAWLPRCRDGLRLIVQLCRERDALVGAHPDARMRRAVVHWLAVADLTHTQLCSALPSSAATSPSLDAVLGAVATFVAPGGAPERAGRYVLRTSAWSEWEPTFAGYTPAQREAAMARAARLAQPPWRPAAALRPPPVPAPPPFGGLCRIARTPAVLRTCRACLRFSAAHPGDAAADDLALDAAQLLALAAADTTAAGGDDLAALAAQLALPDTSGINTLQLIAAAAASADAGDSAVSEAVVETLSALLSDLRARGLAPPAPPPVDNAPNGAPLADAAAAAREERRRAMRERQRAVLAAMEAQQRAFAAARRAAEDAENEDEEDGTDSHMATGDSDGDDASSADMSGAEDVDEDADGVCALCRGDAAGTDADASGGAPAGDCLAWVSLAQPSAIPALAARPAPAGWRFAQLCSGRGAWGDAAPDDATSFATAPGVHLATCGHRVHTACLARYAAALRASYAAGRRFPGEYVLSVASGQFLCPVCRRLANGALPSLPAPQHDTAEEDGGNDGGDELAEPAAVCAAARSAALPPTLVAAMEQQPLHRSASVGGDTLAPLRVSSSLGSYGLAGSLLGARVVRRRSSAAAAAAAAASADAEADRFADRCRVLLGTPPLGARDAGPTGALWATLAFNVAHWETVARPPLGMSGAAAAADKTEETEADAAATSAATPPPERSPHWLASQALCRMALRAAGAPPPSSALRRSLDMARAAVAAPHAPPSAEAAAELLSWLAGADCPEPPSLLLGAFPQDVPAGAAVAGDASVVELGGAELPGGADLLRMLMAGMRAPAETEGDAPDVSGGITAALSAVAASVVSAPPPPPPPAPGLGRLLATGDAFALFCELVAASAAAHNAASSMATGSGVWAPMAVAWTPARVRQLAHVAASVAVAHAAAATGAAATGAAVPVTPAEALLAVAYVVCAPSSSAAPLLAAVGGRCAVALRRCAVLAALLRDASPPPPGDDAAASLDALRLPPLQALLAGVATAAAAGSPAVARWLGTPPVAPLGGRDALRAWFAGCAAPPPAPPLRPPTLLPLPELYQELVLEWSDRPCCSCGLVPDEPALCLACGRLVCCAGTCCASPSGRRECAAHAAACGAGTAVFLLVRATKLLLLRGSRRCVYASPYLDAHGEEDPYLRRGRPLFLNAERYAHVQRLWAAASTDYDTHCLHTSRAGAEHF